MFSGEVSLWGQMYGENSMIPDYKALQEEFVQNTNLIDADDEVTITYHFYVYYVLKL